MSRHPITRLTFVLLYGLMLLAFGVITYALILIVGARPKDHGLWLMASFVSWVWWVCWNMAGYLHQGRSTHERVE